MPTHILILPTTYEQSRQALNPESANYSARLAQFVQPVEDTETQVVEIISRMTQHTGRAVILLGDTGSGKSTFIQSLTWRKHLGFARLISIDCTDFRAKSRLTDLTERLQEVCEQARSSTGVTAVTIDYLESLGGLAREEKRAFFQTLNGLLRKSPVFVVWPVTAASDADSMIQEAKEVSGTVFDGQIPILKFKGPRTDDFPMIVRNTISVFNDGKMLQDFLLTDAELNKIRDDLSADTEVSACIRTYIERVQAHWTKRSGHLKTITDKLPRPNEVWCVFCHQTAEDVVSTFATKGDHPPSAWIAYHAKLWEYIPGTQREARWKNPTRLQYAIGGALTTRILHLSPHALISACVAYGTEPKLDVIKKAAPENWAEKAKAKAHMESTALYRQLVGGSPSKGKTKGGPAADARQQAVAPFEALNKLVAGSGNDRHINHCVAACLRDKLPLGFAVVSEQAHPWIPGITPDIRIDTPDGRQICIEFCYTNNQKPGAVPDYVLEKLATYMDQLEQFVGAGIA
jgi:hypothetical protein